MGLFKWIKKHPWEAAGIAAGSVLLPGAFGIGPAASLFGGEAAAGAAGAAGSLAGGGAEASLFGGGAAEAAALGEGGIPFMAQMGEALPVSGLAQSLMGGAAQFGVPEMAAMTPFAQGATTAAPGVAGMFGPGEAVSKPWLNPKMAMAMAGMLGGGEQRPQQLGAPVDMGNPYQRPALVSQEDIMKKWLRINDPNTYMRLYGQPQGVA